VVLPATPLKRLPNNALVFLQATRAFPSLPPFVPEFFYLLFFVTYTLNRIYRRIRLWAEALEVKSAHYRPVFYLKNVLCFRRCTLHSRQRSLASILIDWDRCVERAASRRFLFASVEASFEGCENEGEAMSWIGRPLIICDLTSDGLWWVWQVCRLRISYRTRLLFRAHKTL